MPLNDSFAARLTRVMEERHLTVSELQEELGGVVSQRTIYRWQRGDSVPGIEALPLLAHALTTTPNQLVGWQEDA